MSKTKKNPANSDTLPSPSIQTQTLLFELAMGILFLFVFFLLCNHDQKQFLKLVMMKFKTFDIKYITGSLALYPYTNVANKLYSKCKLWLKPFLLFDGLRVEFNVQWTKSAISNKKLIIFIAWINTFTKSAFIFLMTKMGRCTLHCYQHFLCAIYIILKMCQMVVLVRRNDQMAELDPTSQQNGSKNPGSPK